jgi:hypothetical protein
MTTEHCNILWQCKTAKMVFEMQNKPDSSIFLGQAHGSTLLLLFDKERLRNAVN